MRRKIVNMKSNAKSKIIVFMILGILFTLSPIMNSNFSFIAGNNTKNSEYSDETNLDNENLKTSEVSGIIYINNNSGWANFRSAGNCTGEGTYSDPYIIEDLVIDGSNTYSCIWIENSNVYFRIENCTLYNAGSSLGEAGIYLYNVSNSQLIDNNCSSNYRGIFLRLSNNNTIWGNDANNNDREGIYLHYSSNNTIWGNKANNNDRNGVYLFFYSNNNTISGNSMNNNGMRGIYLDGGAPNYLSNNNVLGNTANDNSIGIEVVSCNTINVLGNNINYNDLGILLSYADANHTISGNIMNGCGLGVSASSYLEELCSYDIDTSNLVNGKPLYYYTNEKNLGSNDFTNAGQVILVNCTNSIISNLHFSNCSNGIALYYCNDNTILGNTGDNQITGIMLFHCNNNTITGNIENSNEFYGIYLFGGYLGYCDNSTISENTANNNMYGIYLSTSNNNTIFENTANNNNRTGIELFSSDYNTILRNTANNNDGGIHLRESNNNTITENLIKDNSGIGLEIDAIPGFFDSSENVIYLNCFINNHWNAYDEGTNNYWDNGIKGNYWSDYTGLDADGDGIGDVPYNITWGPVLIQDNFPLMKCPISTTQGDGEIPIELIVVISVIIGVGVIGVATILLIRRKRKRI